MFLSLPRSQALCFSAAFGFPVPRSISTRQLAPIGTLQMSFRGGEGINLECRSDHLHFGMHDATICSVRLSTSICHLIS
ncbi:hypothetical protein BYT27DRAFT_7201707 [Phlegmacium glaucopus]|nr:hypothetical protein BYT27DRAFT_7201707 [Phlegmacium glaucopus]